jgi:hypothetical protein
MDQLHHLSEHELAILQGIPFSPSISTQMDQEWQLGVKVWYLSR